ncbi:MAG: N-acetylmuramoyl-L-alanine amidase, partial [Actinomycetota bacterium]
MLGGLLVLAVALRFLPEDNVEESAEPIRERAGAVTIGVTLQAGYQNPIGSGPATGQRLSVPLRSESLVLAAPAGEVYAVRVGAGEDFGPWLELHHPHDEGPDGVVALPGDDDDEHRRITDAGAGPGGEDYVGARRALPPILIDETITDVEVVHLEGTGHGLEANFVAATTDLDDGLPTVAGQQQAGAPAPPIAPRSAWTDQGWADANNGCARGPWYARNLQAVVVHHTVTTNSYRQDQVDDLLRAIRFSHVDVNGWCDIGYNFLVDRFGTIWEGRTGGVDQPVIGGHAKGFNTATMGVALLGQHHPGARPSAAQPSSAAEQAVGDLARWKLALHGIDPDGTTWLKNRSARGPQRLASGQWHRVPTILGHRDLGLTSCPGDHGLATAQRLADRLEPIAADEGVYRYAAWNPHPHGPAFVAIDGAGELRVAGAATMADPAGAAPVAPPSPQPKAVAAVLVGDQTQGWSLHGDGVLHPFGGAPALAERPAGDRQVVELALADARSGWVVAVDGGVFGFGGQADLVGESPVGPVVAADLTDRGDGYLLDVDGRLSAVGAAPPISLGSGAGRVVDLAVHPSGRGGWAVESDGVIHHFGSAPPVEISSPGGTLGQHPAVAIVAAAGGGGGWVATADGQLWPFGRERLVLPL